MNRFIHAIGVSQSVEHPDLAEGIKPNLDHTLYFMTTPSAGAGPDFEIRQVQPTGGSKIDGLIRSIRDKVSGILP